VRTLFWIFVIIALAGCASPRRTDELREAERRAYERGYGQAVKEQYWIIQRLQKPKPSETP
jgi:uncharacterized protein YceK